jgi:gliding motility-associated-like protein
VRHNFCRINDTLRSTVTVNDIPTANASKSNDIDCSNASANLSATGGMNYSWFPLTSITGGNTANPVANPAVTTTYYVTVTGSGGCSDDDSVTVNVLFNSVAGGYNMPNAFTPNNDYKNDCFGLKYWGVVQDLDFSVYNRWGERIFHTSDPSVCWDGNYKGIPQASGTYVYQIKAGTACGDVYKKERWC